MPTIQPQLPSAGHLRAIRSRRPVKIYVKRHWTDQWSATDAAGIDISVSLRPLYVVRNLAPSIDRAALLWYSGEIKEHGADQFEQVAPLDLRRSFVKIVALAPEAPADTQDDPPPGEQTLFIGWVPEETAASRGALSGPAARADQTIMAYGLELLLDRIQIGTAAVDDATEIFAQFRTLGRGLTFNEQETRHGPSTTNSSNQQLRGNRAADERTVTDGSITYPAVHGFANAYTGLLWSAWQAVKHLVAVYFPRGIECIVSTTEEIQAFLENDYPSATDTDQKTVLQVLSELLDPRRGFGWRLEVEDPTPPDGEQEPSADEGGAAAKVKLRIFTTLDKPIRFGTGQTLPANSELADLVLSDDYPLASLSVARDNLRAYRRIVCEGARIIACCSFDQLYGNIEPGWTIEQLDAYGQGAGGADADANDAARADERFRHVFQKFIIPQAWDGTGLGGGNAIVRCLADGSITADAGPGFLRVAGRQILNWIPVTQFGLEDPALLAPQVLILDREGFYVPANDGTRGPGAVVYTLDRDFGWRIEVSPNHLVGGEWQPSKPSNTTAAFDHASYIFTGAFALDERLRVEVDLPGDDDDTIEHDRVLRIRIDDAEAWYIVPGTVIAAIPGQAPKPHPGGLVRNDVARLQNLMASALAVYGRDRATVAWTENDALGGMPPGTFLQRIIEVDGTATTIGSIVTQQTLDLQQWICTCATEYLELELQRLA